MHDAAWWLDAVKREERRGELLAAFDLAERGLAEHPDDLRLKHRAVLALARAGATEEASRRFAEYGLAGVSDDDVAALRARIAKDIAITSEGAGRARDAERAAGLYGAIFERTGVTTRRSTPPLCGWSPARPPGRGSWRGWCSGSSRRPRPVVLRSRHRGRGPSPPGRGSRCA